MYSPVPNEGEWTEEDLARDRADELRTRLIHRLGARAAAARRGTLDVALLAVACGRRYSRVLDALAESRREAAYSRAAGWE
jgi:hypothetical protein